MLFNISLKKNTFLVDFHLYDWEMRENCGQAGQKTPSAEDSSKMKALEILIPFKLNYFAQIAAAGFSNIWGLGVVADSWLNCHSTYWPAKTYPPHNIGELLLCLIREGFKNTSHRKILLGGLGEGGRHSRKKVGTWEPGSKLIFGPN